MRFKNAEQKNMLSKKFSTVSNSNKEEIKKISNEVKFLKDKLDNHKNESEKKKKS